MERPSPRQGRAVKLLLLLLVLILAAAIASLALLRLHRQAGSQVEVLQGGTVVDRLPLDRDLERRYESGNGGYNLVRISGGRVEVTEASCPDKICVRHGPTDQTADPITCLPNRLVVRVTDPAGKSQLDGVSS